MWQQCQKGQRSAARVSVCAVGACLPYLPEHALGSSLNVVRMPVLGILERPRTWPDEELSLRHCQELDTAHSQHAFLKGDARTGNRFFCRCYRGGIWARRKQENHPTTVF